MNKAVLFLVFNRLDTTMRVFEEIRKAKPPRLYIASDAARDNRPGEHEKVAKTRKYVLDNVDWDCDVKTLFREENLGCKVSVSSAISWFFENEQEGIILEDDCLPNQSFFTFCEELLEYYRNDKRVMHISGDQFVSGFGNGYSYYFAIIEHCWGWATWADRWKYYTHDLKNYESSLVKKFSDNEAVQQYWLNILEKMKRNEIDSWAYAWTFNIIKNDGFCINPSKNLISNIGFGASGTHTANVDDPYANLPIFELGEIVHPKVVSFDWDAINYIYENHFGIKISKKETNGMNEKLNKMLLKINIMLKRIKKISSKIYNKIVKNDITEEQYIFETYKGKKRFVEEKIKFKGRLLVVPDVVSFAYQIKEIFENEIYKFKATVDAPVIYDCGANIGTSVFYFKKLYPNAIIKAFEADKKIFDVLSKNTEGLNGVELFHNAVWNNNDLLTFNSEGADGGSLIGEFKEKEQVRALRLKELIETEDNIDFLKMDIEGAEIQVIKDCADSLRNVRNIFVEYHSFKNADQELGEILNVLKLNGFRYYVETINKPFKPYIHEKNNDPMDLQVNIFGVKSKI